MFCEVERSYIEDGFNLYGLRACVANFSDCASICYWIASVQTIIRTIRI